MLADVAYKGPPYPTAHHMVDASAGSDTPRFHYLDQGSGLRKLHLFSNRTLNAKAVKRADGKYDVTIDVESKKLKADEKANETEVAVNDWIEIGALAKPAKGKNKGPRYTRAGGDTAETDSHVYGGRVPEKAGIDPFILLLDRMPSDNVKKVAARISIVQL